MCTQNFECGGGRREEGIRKIRRYEEYRAKGKQEAEAAAIINKKEGLGHEEQSR